MLIDIINPLLENPIFVKYGILGLFFNSVLSGIIPFPSEIATSALILAGQDLILIFTVLSIGGVLGVLYYILYHMMETKFSTYYTKDIRKNIMKKVMF